MKVRAIIISMFLSLTMIISGASIYALTSVKDSSEDVSTSAQETTSSEAFEIYEGMQGEITSSSNTIFAYGSVSSSGSLSSSNDWMNSTYSGVVITFSSYGSTYLNSLFSTFVSDSAKMDELLKNGITIRLPEFVPKAVVGYSNVPVRIVCAPSSSNFFNSSRVGNFLYAYPIPTKVVIPKSVVEIGNNTFNFSISTSYCPKVISIVCEEGGVGFRYVGANAFVSGSSSIFEKIHLNGYDAEIDNQFYEMGYFGRAFRPDIDSLLTVKSGAFNLSGSNLTMGIILKFTGKKILLEAALPGYLEQAYLTIDCDEINGSLQIGGVINKIAININTQTTTSNFFSRMPDMCRSLCILGDNFTSVPSSSNSLLWQFLDKYTANYFPNGVFFDSINALSYLYSNSTDWSRFVNNSKSKGNPIFWEVSLSYGIDMEYLDNGRRPLYDSDGNRVYDENNQPRFAYESLPNLDPSGLTHINDYLIDRYQGNFQIFDTVTFASGDLGALDSTDNLMYKKFDSRHDEYTWTEVSKDEFNDPASGCSLLPELVRPHDVYDRMFFDHDGDFFPSGELCYSTFWNNIDSLITYINSPVASNYMNLLQDNAWKNTIDTISGGMVIPADIVFAINSSNGLALDEEDVTFDMNSSYTYTGSAITSPKVTSVKYKGRVLGKNSHYQVSISNNTDAGKATITVVGIGLFAGNRISRTFTINPASMSSVTVGSISSYPYTGSAITPTLSLTFNGSSVSSSYYSVSFSNNTNAGNASYTITGSGNFTGTKTGSFTISPKSIESDVTISKISDQTYTGSQIKPNLTVKWGDITLQATKDYTASYSKNTAVGTASVTITGTGNYSGSLSANFNIVARNISDYSWTVSLSQSSYTYTGSAIKPEPVVKNGSNTLTKDTDYTLSYSSNVVDVGSKVITIKAIGSWTGSMTQSYSIVAKSIASSDISYSSISDQTYTGSQIKPSLTVKDTTRNVTLSSSTDYSLSYSSNTAAGTATITVSGSGNYNGSKVINFTILPKNISGLTFSLSVDEYVYDGTAKSPTVTVQDGTTKLGTSDFSVSYSNNTNVGTKATVSVEGTGNYSGTKDLTFTIKAFSLANAYINATNLGGEYNGEAYTPSVTVFFDSAKSKAIPVADFSISFKKGSATGDVIANPTDAGTYYIVISPSSSGNLSGTNSSTVFSITRRSLKGNASISAIPDQDYTGSPISPTVVVTDSLLGKLTVDKDYTVSLSENTQPGQATVTVDGVNNYQGSLSTVFTIVQRSLSEAVMTLSKTSFEYNAKNQVPTVSITLAGSTLEEGDAYTLTFYKGTIGSGNTIEKAQIINPDTYYVVANGIGKFSSQQTGSFTISKGNVKNATVTVSANFTYDRNAHTPTISAVVNGRTLTSSDFDVAYYKNSSLVESPTDAGTYQVVLTGKGNYENSTDADAYSFEIKKASLVGATITLNGNDAVFSGSAIKRTVNNVVTSNSLTLETSEYSVKYYRGTSETTDFTNVGTISVKVVAKSDNFSGEESKSYRITQKSIASDVTVSKVSDVEYTGNPVEPEPDVMFGGITLVKGEDYDLSYTSDRVDKNDHTNVSTVTITISAKGNYSDSLTTTFKITQRNIAAVDSGVNIEQIDDVVYDGNVHKVEPIVMFNGVKLNKTSDYTVVYYRENVVSDNFTKFGTIRVEVTGVGNFTGKLSGSYTINKCSITKVSVDKIPNQTYTGKEIIPTVVVRFGETTLQNKQDYSIQFSNNTSVGTANVTITGLENFEGTKDDVTFEIVAKDLTELSGIENRTAAKAVFNGKVQKLEPLLYFDNVKLVGNSSQDEGVDFTYTYSTTETTSSKQYINAGQTITINVVGCGNYSGTATIQYVISQKDLSDEEISSSLEEKVWTYTGFEITPALKITYTAGQDNVISLTSDDYKITYDDNINAGQVLMTIAGQGNYCGSITKNFEINPLSIMDKSITEGVLETYTYDGKEHEQSPILMFNGAKLSTNDISWTFTKPKDDFIQAQTITIHITGKTNFTDEREVSYVIKAKDISDEDDEELQIEIAADSDLKFTGEAIKPEVSGRYLTMPMTKEKDFTLKYGENIYGSGTVTVTGVGNFSGERTLSFEIESESLDNVFVEEISDIVFDGQKHEIEPEVWKDETKQTKLVKGADYTLTCSATDFVHAKTIIYTITGMNNYKGTLKRSYSILAKNISDSKEVVATLTNGSEYTYTSQAIRPAFTVTYTPDGLDGISLGEEDFNFDYYDNISVSRGSEQEILENAYILIDGKGDYTGQIKLNFKINPATIDSEIEMETEAVYDRTSKKPSIKVKSGDLSLAEGIDYDVSFERDGAKEDIDWINVGKIQVTITAKNNFTGTQQATFEIKPATLSAVSLIGSLENVYDEKEHKLVIGKVTSDTVDASDSEYDVVYKKHVSDSEWTDVEPEQLDWINANSWKVVVKAKTESNFTGEVESETFKILPRSISDGEVKIDYYYYIGSESGDFESWAEPDGTPSEERTEKTKMNSDNNQMYVGQRVMPVLTFNANELTKEKDFTFESTKENEAYDYKTVGEFTLTVNGVGNYSGKITKNYSVSAAPFTSDRVKIEITGEYFYTGEEIIVPDSAFVGTYKETEHTEEDLWVELKFGQEEGNDYYYFEGDTVYIDDAGKIYKESSEIQGSFSTIKVKNGYANNIRAGEAMVFLVSKTENLGEGIICVHFTIKPVTNDKNEISATLNDVNDIVYDGTAKEPSATVVWARSDKEPYTLILGSDYSVEYDNDHTKAGEHKVVIKGLNNFNFTIEQQYVIKQKDISADDVSLVVSEDVTYDKNEHKPTITLTYKGMQLTKENDFDWSFTKDDGDAIVDFDSVDFTNAGKILITITAKEHGNYTSVRTYTYTIKQAEIYRIIATKNNQIFDRVSHKPTLSIQDANGNEISQDEYTLKFTKDEKDYFDIEEVDFTNAGTIKIVVVSTNKNYFVEDVSCIFNILPKSLERTMMQGLLEGGYQYTGEPIKPELTLTYIGETLVEKSSAIDDNYDYERTYGENIESDENGAYVKFTAKQGGNFSGEFTVYLQINKVDISSETKITPETFESVEYNGKEHKSEINIVVTYIQTVLVEGESYSLSYQRQVGDIWQDTNDFVNAGIIQITIKGKGNFSGTATRTIEITPISLDDERILVKQSGDTTYTGKGITRDVVVQYIVDDDNILTLTDAEYEVSYQDNVIVKRDENGEIIEGAELILTAKKDSKNYRSTVTKKFKIEPRDIGEAIPEDLSATYNGQIQKLEPKLTYESSDLKKDVDFGVSYTSNVTEQAKAFIDAGQIITIKITGENNFTGSISVEYTIEALDIGDESVVKSEITETVTFTGKDIEPEISLSLGEIKLTNADFDIRYENNKNVGQASIIISGKGNFDGETTINFEIEAKDINDITMTPNEEYEDVQYSEESQLIDPELRMGEIVLEKNIDFKVEASSSNLDDDFINVGTITITVTGQGNYKGTRTVVYEITSKNFTDSGDEIEIKVLEDVYYNGSEQTPEIEVSFTSNGHKYILNSVESQDYDVEYSQNIDAGQGVITINGKNNFTGYKTTNFTINSRDISEVENKTQTQVTYNGLAQKITPVLEYNGKTLESPKDFSFSYVSEIGDENFTDVQTITVNISGNGNFNGTKVITYRITALNLEDGEIEITITSLEDDLTYTGEQITPNIEVKFNGEVVNAEDYTVSYGENINVSELGSVTITANPGANFSGSKTQTFSILRRTLSEDMVAEIENVEYNGQLQNNVEPVVTYNERVLAILSDYTISYSTTELVHENEFITAGQTITISIKGCGNFEGEISAEYDIIQKDLDSDDIVITVTSSEEQLVFTGGKIEAEIQVMYGSLILENDKDYTISYGDNIEAGDESGIVTITAKENGNYSGTKFIRFKIYRKTLESSMLKEKVAPQDYTGKSITPNVALEYNVVALVEEQDYEIEYGENINAGIGAGQIILTGNGNYQGVLNVLFDINKLTITEEDVTLSEGSPFTYNWTEIKPESVTVVVNEISLVAGKDYTISYQQDIISAGTKIITIKGINNFEGTVEVEYEIQAKNISDEEDAEIFIEGFEETKPYSLEGATTLSLTLTYLGQNMVQDVDYELKYKNNDHVGNASITIKGINNFNGERTLNFEITALEFDAEDLELVLPTELFEGTTKEEIEFSFDSQYGNIEITSPSEIVEGTNIVEWKFTPSEEYRDNLAEVTGQIEVTGKKVALEEIEVQGLENVKKEFKAYEEFSAVGIKVIGIYNNGESNEISFTLSIEEGTELTVETDKVVISLVDVEWEEEISYEITVYPIDISIINMPDDLVYGQELPEFIFEEVYEIDKDQFLRWKDSFEYQVEFKLDNELVDERDLQGGKTYEINVLLNNKNFNITNVPTQRYVKSLTLLSNVDGIYAESSEGFDEGLKLKAEEYIDKVSIRQILGDETYKKLGNIDRIYVLSFETEEESQIPEMFMIYIHGERFTTKNKLYITNEDGENLNELEIFDGEIVLFMNRIGIVVITKDVRDFTLIYVAVGIGAGLIVLLIILISYIHWHKVKKRRKEINDAKLKADETNIKKAD